MGVCSFCVYSLFCGGHVCATKSALSTERSIGGRGIGRGTSLRIQPSQIKAVFVGWVVQTTLASKCNTFSASISLGTSTISHICLGVEIPLRLPRRNFSFDTPYEGSLR